MRQTLCTRICFALLLLCATLCICVPGIAAQEEVPPTDEATLEAEQAHEKEQEELIEDSLEAEEEEEVEEAPEVEEVGLSASASTSQANITYQTHVQTHGWQGWVRNGAMSGTSGQSKRLEGIKIKLDKQPCAGDITYRTHVQTYGWQEWKSNGAMSGTSGQSKRLEAIEVKLTGEMANTYDVWYRVHAQTYGWMGWAKNGARAGTATMSKRLEAIEIRVLPKNSDAPGSTERPYATRQLQYRTHVQTHGWQDWVYDGAVSGTTGSAKRLEGINIKLSDQLYSGSIQYRTHVQTYGWQGWKSDGAMSGTSGQSKRLEAIEVKLTGEMANTYDVWYRVHAQTYGWMGWAKNGQKAGTAGYAKRLEAIQILLTAKGSSKPSTNYGGIQQNTTQAFLQRSESTPSTRGASDGGALKVAGNKLVDKNGNAMQLRGVSTHGLAWFPDYVNDACFKQLRDEWSANVVRLAMYTEEYGGYCSGGDKDSLKDLVKNGVNLATNNDLYAIVDWHILSDGDPNRHVDEAKTFFDEMSATFKNNTNVLYEICNEPNGGTTWDSIKTYANQVIPVIRQNDPDAIIIVGTPTWSQEVDKAAADPLSYNNVLYSLHFYAATHKDDLRNRMVNAANAGLPIFVSEFGICDASGNGSIDEQSANSWISTMNSLDISWCMWSLCNKNESASALKSSCTATSGFTANDLSTSGTWLLKALEGTLSTGTNDSNDSSTTPMVDSTYQRSATFKSGQFNCTANLVCSTAATGSAKRRYTYELSITNTGNTRSSWNITVTFNKNIKCENIENGAGTTNGSRMIITNASHNGSIASGATITGVSFQVTADSGLCIEP